MPLGDAGGIIVTDPNLFGSILPDQRFERQVDARCLGTDHQRGAPLRIPEDQQLSRSKGLTDFGRAGGMVNSGKDVQAAFISRRFAKNYTNN